MTKIYKTTDKVPVTIDDITFFISPLSYFQKSELEQHMHKYLDTREIIHAQNAAFKAIKYAVKGISGVTCLDGSDYDLEFEDKVLSDTCVDDLLNMEQSSRLSAICSSLINGLITDIKDPETGESLEGISFEDTEKK